jgi:hypothetical protein
MIAFCVGGLFSQMKLDVKTKFKEKYELKGIKYGVIYFLKKNGCKVVEVGEDYTVWLVNIHEMRTHPDKYTLKLTIDIAPPSLFRQKKPIASEKFEVEYIFNPKELNVDDTGLLEFLKEKGENIIKKETVRAFYVGQKVAEKIKLLVL